MLFEYPRKMLSIFESQFIGNFAHRFVRIKDFRFCYINQLEVNVLVRRFSGFLFDQITEVVGGKIQLVCAVDHGRQSDFLRFVGSEEIIQQCLKSLKNAFVRIIARDELPIIKPANSGNTTADQVNSGA